jgi:cyclase
MRFIAPFTAVSLLGLATVLLAQPAEVKVTTENLAPGVDVLFGQGGNIGVSHGEDGTILIDDQFAPLTPKIQAAVAALGATPVKFLINTHWHGDHSGGNENFGKAGALILAHDNVRVRMASPQTRDDKTTPASPKLALPVVTYHDGLSLHLNGDEVRTYHMHDAHTDGDSIVIWKKANVVHMGDLYFNKVTLPFVDLNSGGSIKGMLAAIEKTLTLINPQTKVIPGHGPMATHADLMGYRDMLKSIIGAVQAGIAAGKGVDQIKAMKPTAKWDVPGGFISGDAFVEMAYKSLTAPGKPAHVAPDNHVH